VSENVSGILEIDPKGFGFLRAPSLSLQSQPGDAYVTNALIDSHQLRTGVFIKGIAEPSGKGSPQLVSVETINELTPDEWKKVKEFSTLEPIQPNQLIRLEGKNNSPSMRVIDLFCPIGKGQRALIVSPPKAGKTMLLEQMAQAISVNHPEIDLLLLLVDERPEEVTEMKRVVKGEVFASSSDSAGAQHIRLAQLVLEYARRKVETGKDVVILLDSLTRMGRAFNVHQKGSGKTMSGGVDSRALEIPRKIFGAARNAEHGGSLTLIATALVDTGSRMDELIFQEFKGTGNMELVLMRELAEERIFPAINLNASGTRREELLFGEAVKNHHNLRRSLSRLAPRDAMVNILSLIDQFPTNEKLLARFSSSSG
jgi:transcription termination factor Rho